MKPKKNWTTKVVPNGDVDAAISVLHAIAGGQPVDPGTLARAGTVLTHVQNAINAQTNINIIGANAS